MSATCNMNINFKKTGFYFHAIINTKLSFNKVELAGSYFTEMAPPYLQSFLSILRLLYDIIPSSVHKIS